MSTLTRYKRRKIARELRWTALGQSHHEKSLKIAHDLPEIVARPELRIPIYRYIDGTQKDGDHIELHEAAILIAKLI